MPQSDVYFLSEESYSVISKCKVDLNTDDYEIRHILKMLYDMGMLTESEYRAACSCALS